MSMLIFFKEKRMQENNRDTNKLAWHPSFFWTSNNHECKCQVEISFMVCFLVALGTVRAKCVTVKPVTSPWVSSLPSVFLFASLAVHLC